MSAQAVANTLELSPISPELSDLTALWGRLINLCKPFMKIMIMHKYGSHYKVNSTFVNVPASVDKICNILSHRPDYAQLCLTKLKKKIVRKSNHIYITA